jgi:hypothetical protein
MKDKKVQPVEGRKRPLGTAHREVLDKLIMKDEPSWTPHKDKPLYETTAQTLRLMDGLVQHGVVLMQDGSYHLAQPQTARRRR